MAVVLVACGTVGTSAPPAPGTALGSVAGRVTAGPTCPVEMVGHPCPPHPVFADVEVRTGRGVIASTHSNADGTYRLQVPAGRYTIVVVPKGVFPRCAAQTANVAAASTVRANINCDTGIR